MPERSTHDVVVVGGGPAGLATALAARLQGAQVVVLDRRRPPLDKPCGEGLMPDGLDALERLGVSLGTCRHHPLAGIRYIDGEVVAAARFPARPGAGIRRLDLHRAMVHAAERVGIDLRWGVSADGLLPGRGPSFGGVATAGGDVRARFVIAADGLRSWLRKEAGLAGRTEPRSRQRFGVRRHLRMAPWSDHVEVYWAERCEAYVTPVAADEVGIALLWHGKADGWSELLARIPALEARVADASAASRDAGCGPLAQRTRAVIRGNLALAGDAAGYVDAITGEGLALAFHQAEALGGALARGSLRGYPRAHRRICAWPDRLTRAVLALERRPVLRKRAIRALAAKPQLFARLLAVHTRALPPGRAVVPTLRLLLAGATS